MTQRRMLVVLAAMALSVAAGCTGRQHERPAAGSAVDTLSNGVPVALARKSAEWVAMWRKAAPGFAPDSLIPTGRSPAHLGQGAGPLDHCVVSETDSSVLRDVMGEISPTGRYLLIADAYRALPDSELDNPAGGEADEAAVLIDYKHRTCDMFMTLGPSYTFDWGGWVDSTHFALAGSESDDPKSCFGFVRFYSIGENSVTAWNTPAVPLALRDPYYAASEERLKARCRQFKASRQSRGSRVQAALGK